LVALYFVDGNWLLKVRRHQLRIILAGAEEFKFPSHSSFPF